MSNRNGWDVVSDHPLLTLFALSTIVDGTVRLVGALKGNQTGRGITVNCKIPPKDETSTIETMTDVMEDTTT